MYYYCAHTRTLQVTSCILLSLVLAACTPPKRTPEQALSVGLETSPLSLDPRQALDATSYRVMQLVFNGLVKKDRASHLFPDLAERWEIPSPRTYIFHLRQGVRFHDGTELTAEDVKATFDAIRDPALKSPKRGSFEQLRGITVMDRYTMKFELSEPFAPFLLNLTTGIVQRDAAQRLGAEVAARPVGTGPFRFERWEADARIELRKHPDYFEGPPKLDHLTYKIVPDPTVRVLELEKGTLDFLQNDIPPDLLPRLEGNPRLKVVTEPGTNYSYLGFNLRDPILQRREVRQALAHAINRQDIITHVLRGLATPAEGIFPPSHWAYAPNITSYGYAPERAKALLEAAGFPDPGFGTPRFSLTLKISQNELQKRIAEAIQEQLKAVGIAVTLNSLEWGTFFGQITSGNFQMYTLSWVGITDPDIFYYIFHHESLPPKGANRGHYINPEVSALIEHGRRTLDLAERRGIYGAVQQTVAQDLPYVSLWFSTNVAVMRADLQGFELYPAGDLTSFKRVYLDSNRR